MTLPLAGPNRILRVYELLVKRGPLRPIEMLKYLDKLGCTERTMRYCLTALMRDGRVVKYKDITKDMRYSYYKAVVANPGDALAVRAREVGVQIPAMAISD